MSGEQQTLLYEPRWARHRYRRRIIEFISIPIFLFFWVFTLSYWQKARDLGLIESFGSWTLIMLAITFYFPIMTGYAIHIIITYRPFRIYAQGISQIKAPLAMGIHNEDVVIPFENVRGFNVVRPNEGRRPFFHYSPPWCISIDYVDARGKTTRMRVSPFFADDPDKIVDLLNERISAAA